jgi:putative endonuclease
MPANASECFVYIVECTDGSLYTGWTKDLGKRVAAHNAGRGSRYTRLHRPVRLVYWERCTDRAEAQRRELAIKRMKRAAKCQLVAHSDPGALHDSTEKTRI